MFLDKILLWLLEHVVVEVEHDDWKDEVNFE